MINKIRWNRTTLKKPLIHRKEGWMKEDKWSCGGRKESSGKRVVKKKEWGQEHALKPPLSKITR